MASIIESTPGSKIKVHMRTYNILLLHTDIMWQTLMFQFAQFHEEFGL